MKNLQKNIKYKFKNIKILKQCLTHRSYNKNHNEKLEFLGDSILNFIITKIIYKKFSYKKEGYMTRIRSNLVNKKNLFKKAKKLKLNKYLLLGLCEIKMKGQYKKSILANTLEAILGGIYLDSKNINIVENTIKYIFLYKKNFKTKNTKDSKTILQEYLQKYKIPLPKYYIYNKLGKDHEKTFIVHCKINNKITKGKAKNKKIAEQIAAKKALIKLGI